MQIFNACHVVNDYLAASNEVAARNELIKLLAKMDQDGLEYSPLINHLIREVGLFPYMNPATSLWQDRYIYEAFKSDIGDGDPITLHREQSRLLNTLLSGKNIAVSAPTSFGKSFVIDSFISIKKPSNVVILVPTIALADETRRRLQRKFGEIYKIITTPDQSLSDKNILIFPQERALGYIKSLTKIDILIVDEFYKASKSFDEKRSPSLIRAIICLSKIADQRYFLAPNITDIKNNIFTEDMEFLHIDFNTLFLEKEDLYTEIGNDQQKKSDVLLRIISANTGKTLIYAGTYSNVKKLSTLFIDSCNSLDRVLLHQFQSWLAINYDPNWELTKLIIKGVGIHNGQLHRSLGQIQIKLFEEDLGIDRIISTSSIIEGVNTSAQNVILWSNKNGRTKINDFTYKNIIGRSGRMFRHFVGKVFVLEKPPTEENTQLDLEFPDELLGSIDNDRFDIKYTQDQVAIIKEYENKMKDLLGVDNLNSLRKNDTFQSSNSKLILAIANNIKGNLSFWNGLAYLNSDNPDDWTTLLYRVLNLQPDIWEIEWKKYIKFIKILTKNWYYSIPEMLDDLSEYNIGIDDFFKLERNTTFKLASILSDLSVVYNRINKQNPVDISLAISRMAHAFLPSVVYQLEEYGLPRMISKKIHDSGIIKLDGNNKNIYDVINEFRCIGDEKLIRNVGNLDEFDSYIIRYFYDGIR